VFADPPFNIGFGKSSSAYFYGVSPDKTIYYNDGMTKEEYIEWCGQWINEAFKILRENGILVIMSSWNHISAIEMKANEIGFTTLNHLIWRYEFGVHCTRRFTTSHYTYIILLKGEEKKNAWTFNKPEDVGKNQEDVERKVKIFLDEIDTSEREKNVEKIAGMIEDIIYTGHDRYSVNDFFDDLHRLSKRYTGIAHPCKLSEDVLIRIFSHFSNEGDKVVDLFMGAGTSMVAAIFLKRKYIGFEINEKYKAAIIDLVNRRIEKKSSTRTETL
jgi:site-specific DNA-methyltransferase (adenine-specific)